MTTLRRERIQKFKEIIKQSEIYSECDLQWKESYLEEQVQLLAESLADASISRSEIAGEYKVTKLDKLMPVGIESAMFAGRPVTEEDINPAKTEHDALVAFETAFALQPARIQWYSPKKGWLQLRKDLAGLYTIDKDCFKKYKAWLDETGKYQKACSEMDLVRGKPELFMASWDVFVADTNYGNFGIEEQNKFEDGSAYV